MEWIGDARAGKGVREQGFRLECDGRTVPGILWTREGEATDGRLVLLGHGGSLHKRADYILGTARRLVRHHGIAAAAIDGPNHGDRREDGGSDPESVRKDAIPTWERPSVTDETVADWRAALDAVQEVIGEGPVGYFGLSMGTMMGVPLIAAEPRVCVAALGLMGVWGPTAERLAEDAARLTCPVRFLVQWDDEVVARRRALELFDRIGSQRKALRAHPGLHVEVPAAEMREIPAFLASGL